MSQHSNRTGTPRLAALCAGLLLALVASATAPAAIGTPITAPLDPILEKISGTVKDVIDDPLNQQVDVILVYHSQPGLIDRVKILVAGGNIREEFTTVPAVAARLDVLGLLSVVPDPKVAWVSLDAKMTASAVRPSSGLGRPAATPAPRPPLYTGEGVGVAILDSGVALHPDLANAMSGYVDVTGASVTNVPGDPWGHGTHVAGIIAGSGQSSRGVYRGIATGADVVSVRVLDENGEGKVSDVISGLDWVLTHRTQYGIRVVNLSLGHPVFEPAALDPLVQAVESLWNAGIVVVCSAGNQGKNGHFTITSPGNSSRVISVGSLTDWGTAATADDIVSTYSSRGPTHIDHFAKPDLIARGNKVVSLRSNGSRLDRDHADWRVKATGAAQADYFLLSGTSMAAPAVAGAAAILLEKDGSLSPDTVKARLMLSAAKRPGDDPYARGAGLLNVGGALAQNGRTTYAGSPVVTRDPYEPLLYPGDTGALWGDTALWSDFALWGDTALWSDTALWGDTALWSDFTTWGDTALWSDFATWGDSTPQGD